MKRRLDLAAALIHNPSVLFLDEPTTGLDPVSRARGLGRGAASQRAVGMTIFLTTQYLEEADALADRVGIIDRGQLIAEGHARRRSSASLGADVIVAKVEGDVDAGMSPWSSRLAGVERVERHGDELHVIDARRRRRMLSPVAVALEGCDVRVRNLTMRTPTLDDVFLELTGEHLAGVRRGEERGDA